MKPQPGALQILVASLAPAVGSTALAGQELIGVYLWQVTTQDGDAVVEPGETATVSLWLDMTPSVVDSQTDGNQGVSAMIFDTVAGPGAANGQILGWQINEDLGFLTGDLTTTDGVSLFNINTGQLTLFGPFSHDDPIHVISFEWKPDLIDDYVVQYMTSTSALEVWEGAFDSTVSTPWTPVEAQISFQVFPTPGSVACILAACGLLSTTRRRPTPRH